MTNLDSILKSRNITLPTKVSLIKAVVFPVVMYGCESWTIKKSWVLKTWCFCTVVLEKTHESPSDCKEIKLVNPKGNQPWVLTGCWSWSANTLATWWKQPTHWKSLRCWRHLPKDWRQKEKGVTENEMVGWHHQLNRHESEQTPEDSEGQGSLANCSLWGHKELDTTVWLNNSVSCLRDTETSTRWKKLTAWRPDCSHDMSCHNSEDWPQGNGSKLTVELKINYT